MDLKSGYPFWAVKNGLMHAFPRLEKDTVCDVAIVGGGITGTLIAQELSAHDFDVVVLEQRDIGWGSTSASTALLQYEIDTPMMDLARDYGEDNAVLAYKACATAITDLQQLARSVKDVGFAQQKSLYYASRRQDLVRMTAEFELRRKHGFEMEWLDATELTDRYRLTAPGAILSALAARMDPYRMAYRLLARLARAGVGIYDRTAVTSIRPHAKGVRLTTQTGHTVRCRHVVMAAGYANEKWLSRTVAKNRSSYAFITDPVDPQVLGPFASTLVWESARPYVYMRSTGDHRLLIGGEDDDIDVPKRRDRRVESKAQKLIQKVQRRLPHLSLQPAFCWAGTFAETKDGLPFFGPHPERGPRVLFAMAYGGNGISYSSIGAGLLRAHLQRRPHPLSTLFGFDRLKKMS